ncbi:hypothetical protein TWF481_010300 [Arthrobotrys musiformis]|uniref:Clr5 domain-containing protein n=1 Tax=Arthrobotrys musiformis TaxID=47236 RepID=A0AAV9W386_9PEZI
MTDGNFRQWSREPVRGKYLKIKDMEDHKEFILSERRAGTKQKDIIEALEVRGVKLPIHKLKRMLNKWEASNHNITKKIEMSVRHGIEKRQRGGKWTHKVVMKRKGKQLTQEQLTAIMAASSEYFKGVKPSSKDLVVLSTPTPKSVYEDSHEGIAEFPENIELQYDRIDHNYVQSLIQVEDALGGTGTGGEQSDNDDLMYSDEMDVDINSDVGPDVPSPARFLGRRDQEEEEGEEHMIDSEEYQDEEQYTTDSKEDQDGEGCMTDIEEGVESAERLTKVLANLGRGHRDEIIAAAQGHPAAAAEPEESTEELAEIVLSGLNKMVPEKGRLEAPDSSDGDTWVDAGGQSRRGSGSAAVVNSTDNAEAETPLGGYARRKRHELWAQISYSKGKAAEVVEEVKSVSEGRGVSLVEAADIVSREWERSGGNDRLPYHVCKQILDEGIGEYDEGTMPASANNVDGVDNNLLCRIIEENFVGLERAARKLSSDSADRRYFDEYVVHIPFVLSKYGSNHFFAALCLQAAAIVLENLISEFRSARITKICAMCIFNSVGMAADEDALDCVGRLPIDLEPGLAAAATKALNNIQRTVLRKYGPTHPKTLFLILGLADYKDWELVAYGVLHTIQAAIQSTRAI